MADRPWRTSLGLVAVLLWSGIIGIPVLVFHLNSVGLDVGEHLHSAVMFIASQALDFLARGPATKLKAQDRLAPSSQFGEAGRDRSAA